MIRLLHGDAVERLRELDAGSVDAVVTSPPYAEQRRKFYNGIPEVGYPAFTVAWMDAARRALKPAGSVLINIREHVRDGEMSDYVHRTRLAVRAEGWRECDELIWFKPLAPPVGHPGRPRRSWERILWFAPSRQPYCDPKANGAESRWVGMTGGKTGWVHGMKDGRSGVARCRDVAVVSIVKTRRLHQHHGHPAAYPIELAEWMIRLVVPDGGTVLDPFSGSGTTGVAADRTGRNAILCDTKGDYVDLARSRVTRDAGLFAEVATE